MAETKEKKGFNVGRWGSSHQKTQRLYMSCGSGWAVLHSLRYEDAAAHRHSWHLN